MMDIEKLLFSVYTNYVKGILGADSFGSREIKD